MNADRLRFDLIVFDFDGVLTDNHVLVLENGLEAVVCNRSDGLAFDMLRKADMPVLILSTEGNKVVAARAKKLRVPLLQGVVNKHKALVNYCSENGMRLKRTLFVGNDLNDLEPMQAAGWRACPSDAHPRIRKICHFKLKAKGGQGVVRELAESVLGLNYLTDKPQKGVNHDHVGRNRLRNRGRNAILGF